MNEVLKCLEQRRSCRSYASEQLKEEDLQAILRAGTYAATGMGRQSPKIVVLQKPEDIAQLEKMNARIMGKPDAHPFYGAPTVCIVLAAASAFTGVEAGGVVIGNMLNAAWSIGVGSCWIHRAREEFASEEGKTLLKKWGVEGDWIGVGHCILGYPSGDFREKAPRKPDYITKV